jgi:hypothetical protein
MQYKELAANATTTLKTGPGYLQGITVNNAGTSWTLQIFDSVAGSGTAIAGGTAFTVPAAGTGLNYDYGFSNDLTIVASGTTAGSITVAWY